MRQSFQTKLEESNDMIIRDPLSIDWLSFPWENGYTLYRLTSTDIIKPYFISINNYGVNDYEDILLLLNNIEDIFECIPEKQIKIPDLTELKSWLSKMQTSS